MHNGFQISNIIENVCEHNTKSILYSPHLSVFDLFLNECDLNLYSQENASFKQKDESFITYWPSMGIYVKSYSAFVTNQPMSHVKQNPATSFHLNSIIFAHDINMLSMKKEDMYLICINSFRPNDHLIFFPNQMSGFGCNKIQRTQLTYAIPDELNIQKSDRNKIGTFCYNKNLGQDILSIIGDNVEVIKLLPTNLEKLNNELNHYKLVIEFDPFSIINLLAAIACGVVGVLVDPTGMCSQYSDVPNLYVANSVQDLQNILQNPPTFNENTPLPAKYRDFTNFKTTINNIFADNQRKAFVL